MCTIVKTSKGYQANLSVKYGSIELKKITLGKELVKELKAAVIIKENESLTFEWPTGARN
jgi:hypothetical protein